MDTKTHEIAEIIKHICSDKHVHLDEIILFGSRARSGNTPQSDFDFIALTENPLEHQKKMDLWLSISRKLAEQDVTADIHFKSKTEYENDKQNKGKLSYYASKDGIAI